MADRIKGITVEIGGDTTGLSKALSGVNKEIKSTQTQLKDVNKLLKLDPTNTTLLQQKQQLLKTAISETKDKLTHAGIYGVEMSRKTIEDLFDVEINYTTKVSFSTVISVVDTLGGVEINSDKEFTAWTNKSCHIKEGKQILDSACALAYARERYAYDSGDRHRIQNQQDVVVAILNKLSDPHYLAKYPKILENASGSFETTMSYDEITGFAKNQLSTLEGWEVERVAVDGYGAMLPTYSMGSQNLYVMIPDESTVATAKAKIAEYLAVPEAEDVE